MSLRVVFMGTPEFAVPCLKILITEGHDVVSVVTQPDRPKGRGRKLAFSPVKQAALELGLNILQPEKVRDSSFIDLLTKLDPDLIVVVAYGQLLPKEILELPRLGCVNVHASLLPKYRGAAPIHFALINGESVTGVTTMYMDLGMDTGDMILKNSISILSNDTTGDVHDKLMFEGASLLAKTMSLIEQRKAPRISQQHGDASYASKITHDVEKINWQNSAEKIHNLIRGLSPWPGAYCFYQGDKILKVWKSQVLDKTAQKGIPGDILGFTERGIMIATQPGIIELLEIQPQSKKRMNALDCAHGYFFEVGQKLH